MEHETLDLGVVSSSPMLGVELPKKKKKKRKKKKKKRRNTVIIQAAPKKAFDKM